MKVNDLLIKCCNIRINDKVTIETLVKDIATTEVERKINKTYEALYLLDSGLYADNEVLYFTLVNERNLVITIEEYKKFN